MRYLIYSTCSATPHLETELEIVKDLMAEKNEVFFMRCEEKFKTCFINPFHQKLNCNICQSRTMNAVGLLNLPDSNIVNLPSINIDESFVQDNFESLSELKRFTYKGVDVGMAAASSIISYLREHDFDVTKHKLLVKDALYTAIYTFEVSILKLQELKPDAVYIFNGRFVESRPMLRACEKLKIKFYTHERGAKMDRYLLRENATPHSIQAVKDEIEKLWKVTNNNKWEIGALFYEERRNKVMQSWAVFTERQIAGKLPDNFNHQKRNVAIFNSSMDEYEGIPDFTNKVYKNDNDGIRQLCESFKDDDSFHFYLRVHPNLTDQQNSQLQEIRSIGEKYSNITIINAEETIDSYKLMESVSSNITFGSTMGIESIYWKKASFLMGRAFYEDLPGIICPASHKELVNALHKDFNIEDNSSAIKYGFWCSEFGNVYRYFVPTGLFTGTIDGKKIKASLDLRIKYQLAKIKGLLFN